MGPNRYGKAEVRLVKVRRDGDWHDLRDLTVSVSLAGDFDRVHVAGDNSSVLPTDSMMRAVYALAADDPLHSIEQFGQRLAEHFLAASPAATQAEVRLLQHPWGRIDPHAFLRDSGQRTATVSADRAGTRVRAGIADLSVLKTSGSAFAGFLRDGYTLLEETDDRILATVLAAEWSYATLDLDFEATWEGVRRALLETFAAHHSQSVQHTLWQLGEAVLAAFDSIERVTFSLPNRHHLLVDLAPYGLANDRTIYHASDRPYGVIEGSVERRA